MRILKTHPLLKMVNSYLIDSPQPANLSYFWNFGSLLAFCLVIQIATGVTLAMHYNPNILDAFNSVEHIMRDVNNGWLLRYLHSNTASAFFFLVYLHIGRGLYYGSYKAPRTLTWSIGTVIFILMMATAFLGYVLPYGQMSLWGATVITNLMSAIPWVGQDIVEFIWGGFSVNNATLNRFFALHFLLPFVLAALALMHLIALHDGGGSNNPLGVSGNYDRIAFAPYFIFKDLITIFVFILILSLLVFFLPNILGDSENYVMANPMQTPPAIVPEWYLLPFYAILRSIPNKLLGVIAMFSAILILLSLPFTDFSELRGSQFKPMNKITFFIFVSNFLVLMQLGAKHVESPFIELGQLATIIFFLFFAVILLYNIFESSIKHLYIYNLVSGKAKKDKKNFFADVYKSLNRNKTPLVNTDQVIFFAIHGYYASKPITTLSAFDFTMTCLAFGLFSFGYWLSYRNDLMEQIDELYWAHIEASITARHYLREAKVLLRDALDNISIYADTTTDAKRYLLYKDVKDIFAKLNKATGDVDNIARRLKTLDPQFKDPVGYADLSDQIDDLLLSVMDLDRYLIYNQDLQFEALWQILEVFLM